MSRRSSRRSIGEWLEDEIDDTPRRGAKRRRRDDDDSDDRFEAITSAISMLEERLEQNAQNTGRGRAGRRPRGDDGDLSDVIAQITNQQDALDYQYEGQNLGNIQRLQNQVRDLRSVVEATARGSSLPGLNQDIHMLQQQLQRQLGQSAPQTAYPDPNFNVSVQQQMQALSQRIGLPAVQPQSQITPHPAYEAPLPVPSAPVQGQVTIMEPTSASIEALRRDVQALRNAMRQNTDPRSLQTIQAELRALTKKLGETGTGSATRDLQEIRAQVGTIGRAVQEGGFHPNNRFVTQQLEKLNENISRVQRPVLPDRLVQDVRTELAEATRKLVPLSVHDAKTLEKNIQFLAERLDSLRARQPDNARLHALEGQIERLSSQLTQSEQLFQSIARMEGSLHELRAQINTGGAGGVAGLDAKAAAALRGFQKQIEDVKALAEASDRRMHQALSAVQDVVVKVAEKNAAPSKAAGPRKPAGAQIMPSSAAPKSAMSAAREAAARAAEAEEEMTAATKRLPAAEIELPEPDNDDAARRLTEKFAAAAKIQAKGRDRAGLDLHADAYHRPRQNFEGSNVTPFRKIRRYASQAALAAAGVALVIGAYNMIGPLLNGEQTATASVASVETAPVKTGFDIPQTEAVSKPQQVAALESTVTPQKLNISLPPFPAGLTNQKLRTFAQNGDVRAFYEIGSRLIFGRGGVAKDAAQGLEWLQLAADKGHAPAFSLLGEIYEKGLGVARDRKQAVANYTAAGRLGNRKALHNLGALYASGVDGEPDFDKAFPLFKQAAELGLIDSQYNLAIVYVNGMGVKQNLTEAYKWFAISAQNGDRESGKKRDEIGSRFDGKTLVKAKLAAQSFKPTALDPAANEDIIPASAWNDTTPAASTGPTADLNNIPAADGKTNGLGIDLDPQVAGKR